VPSLLRPPYLTCRGVGYSIAGLGQQNLADDDRLWRAAMWNDAA
jgi:hypothetical protein